MARKNRRADGAPTQDGIDFRTSSDNAFGQEAQKRHERDKRAQVIFVLAIIVIVVFCIGLVFPKNILNSSMYGNMYSDYTLSTFVNDLQQNMAGLVSIVTGAEGGSRGIPGAIIRYLVIIGAGAGLALCGAIFQGAFRNILVTPSSLGVMSGCSAGQFLWVVLYAGDAGAISWISEGATDSLFDIPASFGSSLGMAVFSFVGAVIVVGIVLLVMVASRGRGSSSIMMVITGMVISSVVGTVTGLVRYYYVELEPDGAIATLLTDLQISSFYRSFTLLDVAVVCIPVIIAFLVAMRYNQQMMLLSISQEEQRSLGINTSLMRVLIIGLCTLVTAIITSFCGMVAFVGFMVPMIARRWVGPNFRYLLPASALLGSVFVLTAYVALQITFGPDQAQMMGMYMSFAGAIVFLVVAANGKGEQSFGNIK